MSLWERQSTVTRVLWLSVLAIASVHPIFAQTASREMNAGVGAYKSAEYEAAIGHFRKATALDPNLAVAHVYLGSAYAQMYIPGDESADNLLRAENSLAEFKKVLEVSPSQDQRMSSLKALASLNSNLKRYDDAQHC